MKSFLAINRRNMGLYFRDFSAVFFSLLSMLIVIFLMVFFLGDVTGSAILDILKLIPGRGGEEDAALCKDIVFLWTCAGIITINASTVTHSFYSNMIKDRTGNRLNSLMVMPVNRSVFVLGYVSSSWITGVMMSVFTLIVTEIIGVIKGVDILPVETQLKMLLLIMVNTFVFSSIMFLFASMVKSQSAWSGIGIVLGTLSGFLGGIYFPIGQMSPAMQKMIKFFPFIYSTSAMRKIMLNPVEDTLFDGTPELMRRELDKLMGMDLFFGKNQLSQGSKVGILMAVGVVFVILSTIHITYSKKKDR